MGEAAAQRRRGARAAEVAGRAERGERERGPGKRRRRRPGLAAQPRNGQAQAARAFTDPDRWSPPWASELWITEAPARPRRGECGRGGRRIWRRRARPEVWRFVRPIWAAPRSGPRRRRPAGPGGGCCRREAGLGCRARWQVRRGRRGSRPGRARAAFVAQQCSLGLFFKVQVIRSGKCKKWGSNVGGVSVRRILSFPVCKLSTFLTK